MRAKIIGDLETVEIYAVAVTVFEQLPIVSIRMVKDRVLPKSCESQVCPVSLCVASLMSMSNVYTRI